MAREYSRIFLKVILVLKQPWKVCFGTSKLILKFSIPYFGPQCPQIAVPQPKIGPQCPYYLAGPPHIKFTSISIYGIPTAYEIDLNVHLWRSHRVLNGPQCPFMAVPPRIKWTSMFISGGPTEYYWTSMSISGGSNRILLDLNVHIEL